MKPMKLEFVLEWQSPHTGEWQTLDADSDAAEVVRRNQRAVTQMLRGNPVRIVGDNGFFCCRLSRVA